MRRVRFLEPMTASILSQRPHARRRSAWPAAAPGALGINRVERADGRVEMLDHIGSVEMEPGDVFVVETPGGGGYGSCLQRTPYRLAMQASVALAAGARLRSSRRRPTKRPAATALGPITDILETFR